MFSKKSERINIMLVCGSGIVTSTLVYPQVESILQKNHYNYRLIKGGFHDIRNHPNVNLILATMTDVPSEVKKLDIPVIAVTALLKGDTAEIEEQINAVLRPEGK